MISTTRLFLVLVDNVHKLYGFNVCVAGCTMFTVPQSSKSEFLDKARQAREERKGQKDKEKAATHIQALVRSFLCRRKLKKQLR